MDAPAELANAHERGKPVRIHRSDGEELVVRILDYDHARLVYAVYTSTHPERYGVCDSTGFELEIQEIERIEVLEQPPPRWRPVIE